LQGSSPAIERHRGFVDALRGWPDIRIVATLHGDWTEESAYEAVMQCPSDLPACDYVFGHNDRMAVGARRALAERGLLSPRTAFCGIDGLPGENGGIRLVRDSVLSLTYVYPTQGDRLLTLAMDILEGRPFERENLLTSAPVTPDNAGILLLQADETQRRQDYLNRLHDRTTVMLRQLETQRMVIFFAFSSLGLLLLTFLSFYIFLRQRTRIKRERTRLARQRLELFTRIGHDLRTPLTLIEGPLSQLASLPEVRQAGAHVVSLVGLLQRNARQLTELVGKILDTESPALPPDATHEEVEAATLRHLHETAPAPTPDESPEEDVDDNPVRPENPRLLIVDDNADLRFYLRTLLDPLYTVAEAADGRVGLNMASRLIPDLIISDVMMPVMDGLEFCRLVKQHIATSHIPVILLTARSLSSQQIEGYRSGADAYITKPFAAELLLTRVENILHSRRRLRDIFSHSTTDEASDESLLSQDDLFIRRFTAYVSDHLSDSSLSVEAIAAAMTMSRVQLYRKIRALTGFSPNEQLRKARLLRARQMLAARVASVSEIAYRVGFTSPSYFSRCFKDEFGITPGEVEHKA